MFGHDIVAAEAQTAPLWENVNKQKKQIEPGKSGSGSQNGKTTNENKPGTSRKKRPPPYLMGKQSAKRRKMMYKECRLCELNFRSELELEEHLYSILHHRALDTEFGECHHQCNLCGIKSENLSSYVEHLRNDFHKRKIEKRNDMIKKGAYNYPENSLDRYVDSFLCPPKRAKLLKKEEQYSKEIQSTSKDVKNGQDKKAHSNYSQKPHEQRECFYEKSNARRPENQFNPYDWNPYDHKQRRHCYPDWHAWGQYGQGQDEYAYHDNWNSRWNNGFYQREYYNERHYRRNWGNDYQQQQRSFELDLYAYGENKHVDKGKTQNKPNSQEGKPLTGDQARTKQLVARAHQVIQNGRNNINNNNKAKKKKKKGKNKLLNKSQSSSSLNSVSCGTDDSGSLVASNKMTLPPTGKKKKKGKGLTKNANSLPLPTSTGSQHGKILNVGGKTVSNLRCTITQPISSHSKSLSSNDGHMGPAGTSNGMSAGVHRRLNQTVLDKFKKQLNKELGPARTKKSPPMNQNTAERVAPVELIKEKNKSGDGNEPASSDCIRAKFRKILDEIDKPVTSATEILRNAERCTPSNVSNGTEISQNTSWAESSRVSGTFSDDTRVSEEVSQGSGTATKTHSTNDSTLYSSLPKFGGLLSGTPLRDPVVISSDADTPTSKKRTHPQPNLNKARRRITQKQKESPDVTTEARQAKLQQLLQKYDRNKKNSPDLGNEGKKPTGPRFGIELNFKVTVPDALDIEAMTESSELVEILPEKRLRSLSENDSLTSHTTVATTSVKNLSTSSFGTNIPQLFPQVTTSMESQQRTSTPVVAPVQTLPQPTESLNARLLTMSEREESLHTSVRSLIMQEANMQMEIDRRTKALQRLKFEIDDLEKRKLSIDALKRKQECDLENLRQERLAILRDNVCSTGQSTPATQSGHIFQDVTLNHRQTTPNSFPSTNIFNPVPANQSVFKRFNSQNTKQKPLFSLLALPSTETGKSVAITSSTSSISSSTPTQELPDFNLSKVKSEVNTEENIPFPTNVPDFETQVGGNITIKKEKLDDVGTDMAVPNLSESNKSIESTTHTIESDVNSSSIGANSTQFFSFTKPDDTVENSSSTSAKVDKILAKYRKQTPLLSNVSPKVKSPKLTGARKRKMYSTRRSFMSPESTQAIENGTIPAESSQARLLDLAPEELPGPTEKCNPTETLGHLPNNIKTHEQPLIGMKFVKEGLLTCSQDETMVLHCCDGKRYSLSLGATPTSITSVVSEDTSFAFVATQKIVSQKQASDNADVIKKVEHSLNVYAIKNTQNLPVNNGNVILLLHSMKMKTRVLCMHYDKGTLFCGMKDGMVAIISLDSFNKPRKEDTFFLECHSHSAITCLTSGYEGPRRILCCGSQDCTVSVRDAIEGLLLRTIQGHTKTVTSLQLVHNELFSASVDRFVLGHDLTTGKLLHKFSGHAGAVRSLFVISDILITLCADRNIRFFDTKTSRLMQKPKEISSLPMHISAPLLNSHCQLDEKYVYVGCEDSTVIRIKLPNASQAKEVMLSPKSEPSKSPVGIVNLAGKFKCKWEGCSGFGTFDFENDLRNHVLSVHINTTELARIGEQTLSVGTCCQWESCTHYFAPELDTLKDVTTHIQRHIHATVKVPSSP